MSQSDCFLKLVASKSGVVKGESGDTDFPNHIALTAWSWGVQAPFDGFSRTGKSQARSLEFSCVIDSSYPALLSILVTNDSIKTATLEMRRAGGAGGNAKAHNFLSINLKRARLASVQISHSAAELIPVVRGTLVFEEIAVDYRSQGIHGAMGGGASTFTWQISDQA
jgi:type VI protein secretion system component Hcp